ncbi:MAG: hypothetical protein LUF78_02345 [Clostridiales bacterium]|nr:hypothetical protein [Clostridiales bacterium]
MSKFDFKGTGTFALVNNKEAAIQLFEDYDTPYHLITKGENAGKIRIKRLRDSDYMWYWEQEDALKRQRYADIVEHSIIFRDVDDELIFCFSPYHIFHEKIGENGKPKYKEPEVPGYECEVRYPGIYGNGTATAVFRKAW